MQTKELALNKTIKKQSTDITPNLFPSLLNKCTNAAYIAFFQINPDKNVVYTALTEHFPVILITGNKYFFILYHYSTTAILAEPMSSKSDHKALRAYEKLYTYLQQRGFTVSLNVMNNEASIAVKQQIEHTGASFQLVEPYNHCVNDAERAIQTFKHHFIAGLCSADPGFPISLWDTLMEQAVITLN